LLTYASFRHSLLGRQLEMHPPKLNVLQIESLEELKGYWLVWQHLLAKTRGATWFHTLEWLTAYWRHSSADQQLRVLVVQHERGTVGILPLVLRTETTRLGSVRVLTYPLADWGTQFGPLGDQPALTLFAGCQHIARQRRAWDIFDLRWVLRDEHDAWRTPTAMHAVGFSTTEGVWCRSARIDLEGGWEAYWAARDSRWRSNVRRSERRLARSGCVTHVRHRPEGAARGDADPRWDLLEDCLLVARRSWQGDADDGTTLSHPEVSALVREAHAAAVRAGAVDLHLLYVDGRPAAFNYGYHYRGHFYGLRQGYDAEIADGGAGNVLMARVIQGCCEVGDQTMDLGPGSLWAKRHWQTGIATSYHYTHYPRFAPRAQLLRWKRSWRRPGEETGGRPVRT
jgi:CelD/BcsL family acetyltransferase involved in cellulose biosynthesis